MSVEIKNQSGHAPEKLGGCKPRRQLLLIAGGFIILVAAVYLASRYLFRDEQPPTSRAIQQVEQLQKKKNVEGLRQSIQSPDAEVAVRALQGLSSVAGDAARADLQRVVREDRRPEVREAAVLEYARVGTESDVPVLSGILSPGRESSADVRAAAARSLGEIRVWSSANALIAGLQDPEVYVRQCAISAINKITNPVRFNFNPEASADERAAAVEVIRQSLPRFRRGFEQYVREQQKGGGS